MIKLARRVDEIRAQFRHLATKRLPMHWLDGYLLHILGKESVFFITDGDYLLSDAQLLQLAEGIDRMQAGEPLAYLTGKQGFWRDEFIVSHDTLIPRPDTERLVEAVLAYASKKQTGRLLDMGTGTGCIGISLAQELPSWQVLLSDFSVAALTIAQQNIAAIGVQNVQTRHSDWYKNIDEKFDIIVSNPPYIDPKDVHLDALKAEPITALAAANHGLADIEQIISAAPMHLNAHGLLAIEHGYDQAARVAALLDEAGFQQVRTLQDFGGNDRLTLGVWMADGI